MNIHPNHWLLKYVTRLAVCATIFWHLPQYLVRERRGIRMSRTQTSKHVLKASIQEHGRDTYCFWCSTVISSHESTLHNLMQSLIVVVTQFLTAVWSAMIGRTPYFPHFQRCISQTQCVTTKFSGMTVWTHYQLPKILT